MFVSIKMEQEHWVLFSKKEGECPHCDRAKQKLVERMKVRPNTTLNIIPQDKYESKSEFESKSNKEIFPTTMKTWPKIFILRECKGECKSDARSCSGVCKNTLIGGCADLREHLKKLEKHLNKSQ